MNYYSAIKRETKRLKRISQSITFLKDCIHFKLTPKFMKIRNDFITRYYSKQAFIFERNLIKKYIRFKYSLIEKIKNDIERQKESLKRVCDRNDFNAMLEKIEYFSEMDRQKMEEKQRKKLGFWMRNRKMEIGEEGRQEGFLNLSKYKLSRHEEELLKEGPRHIIKEGINIKDSVARIETAIAHIEKEKKLKIRSIAQNELTNKTVETTINKEDTKCLRNLRNNMEITLLESDKTGKIVILDREVYTEKVEAAIKKIGAIELKRDPNRSIETKCKLIMKEGKWPNNTKPKQNTSMKLTPRLFAKYKDHKTPPAMRPIVSKCESPTYELEKYLKGILDTITPPSNKTLNSTKDFIEKIKDIEIKKQDKLVSFDVVNLYPSINLEEMSHIIIEKIQTTFKDKETSETLIRTLNLILNNAVFQFNNKFYKQIEGVPMGSPISGAIADWKMRILEEKIINSFKEEIIFWGRYVDDIFAIIRHGNPISILEKINLFDKNIKFTLEIENNSVLNFLDVKIKRLDNEKIETTVYRKPLKNENIIKFTCPTPYNYKTAAIRSHINRALTICSNETLLKEEIEKIKSIAAKAKFPKNTVDKILKERLKKLNSNIPDAQEETKKFTTAIPYMNGIGNKIKKAAKKENIKIPIKSNQNIIKKIRSDKDQIKTEEKNGIYKIKIKRENDIEGFYIGVTKRRIGDRKKEHVTDILKGREGTALAQLNKKEKIEIDFKNIERIAPYGNHTHAYIRETIEITSEKKAINQSEAVFLDERWRMLLAKKREDREENITSEDGVD